MIRNRTFSLTVFLVWFLSTIADRLWWSSCKGVPAWDQADYLNSALDHGRALGIMPGNAWQGWPALLDLSPKIPPLASLINGSVMAMAGDTPAQAAWSLSLWNGSLIIVIAAWGCRLSGKKLALLSVLFVSLAPALLFLRTNYVLELPLAAGVSLALWRLGCWADPHTGGAWNQVLVSAFAVSIALLIKQSAVLILLVPCLFASWCRWHHSRGRLQVLVGIGIILASMLPWLQHNWVTVVAGTNRAVIQSAAKEGDPSLLSLDSWTWYLRLLPRQSGLVLLGIGFVGLLLVWQCYTKRVSCNEKGPENVWGWRWLVFSLMSGWLLTTLSPNKDPRYITPLLPSLILLLARGWLELGFWLQHIGQYKKRHPMLVILLAAALITTLLSSWSAQRRRLVQECHNAPLAKVVKIAGGANPDNLPGTLIVVPSTPDMNQHNVSFYGRRAGGQLVGRQLGGQDTDVKPVLDGANWVVLAEGKQGSVRLHQVNRLNTAIQTSGTFFRVAIFPRLGRSSYSLWRRRKEYRSHNDFESYFFGLATGLAQGPTHLPAIFDAVAVEHMLDGHRHYQVSVRNMAQQRLINDPTDSEAYWSLALLAILDNRPAMASNYFQVLQQLHPDSPWPAAYASVTSLAAWDPWQSRAIATAASRQYQEPVLIALADISSVFSGAIWRLPAALSSLPNAVNMLKSHLQDV
ncbi:phospholipid carrier-dependent glycosyltransferase [cyanobiont of Ornithocercus magnificus]|nr:phospholipid carrier-dependent glycosyltransferase [cyanobiont of Ornithocercus magnificus]